MAVEAKRAQPMLPEQLVEMLALAKQSDSVELKLSPKEFGRRMVAEAWFYPDGSRILELSTKCAPEDAVEVAAKTKAFLAERGVDLTGEQQTKTATALKFFSAELSGTS